MSTQTDLLKTILNQLQDNVIIEEEQLAALYNFLFDPEGVNISFEDQELQESAEFLKDIIQTDKVTTLQQVLDYFEEEKSAMAEYAATIISKNDNKETLDNLHKSIFLSYSRNDNKGKSMRVAVEQFLHQDFHIPIGLGGYAKPIKTYLNQFTDHVEGNMIFILHGSMHREIEARKISDVYWKVDHVNHILPSCIYEKPLLDQVITTNFDELLGKISNEAPLYDISVKVGLTTLFACTKISFHNSLDIDLSIPMSKREEDSKYFSGEEMLFSWLEKLYSETLADKKWAILKSPKGHSWLTSDNPGFIIEKTGEFGIGKLVEFMWDKLNSRNARFYYPLSKDYCLRIGNSDNQEINDKGSYIDFEQSSNEEWYEVNSNTYQTRREMVIASERNLLEQFKFKNE